MGFIRDHQDEDEYEEEEFVSRKEGPSYSKEPKSNDSKTNATRSKHSVTEQRRRIKINERFQILRDLIPNGDQRRDTASFLLEVIEYVQYLQEKVQRCEGLYQEWNAVPSKLTTWRNNHWRGPSFIGDDPEAMKNGPALRSAGKFEESGTTMNPKMHANMVGFDPTRESPSALPPNTLIPDSMQCNTLNAQPNLIIEGGVISVSSIYSQGLLNTLTEVLEGSGVDLSQATLSVQIDLNKLGHVNHSATHLNDGTSEETMRAQKKLKAT